MSPDVILCFLVDLVLKKEKEVKLILIIILFNPMYAKYM